ncbi:MAG: DUF2779 domain-containing protein [bacterium]|nr:DUF2779 domain-containing protein [bacterium]
MQCYKRLWLHKKHKELADPESEETQMIFARGTDVGVLAQGLFSGGIDAQGEEEYANPTTAQRTAELMALQTPIIYEAAFIYKDVICAVDILVRHQNGYFAYEVKSTNSLKPQHINDAALQYWVLTGAGVNLSDFFVVHFNREYVRMGALSIQALFEPTSVLGEIFMQQEMIGSDIQILKKVLRLKKEPDISIGKHCSKPYPCNFSVHCNNLLADDNTQIEELEASNLTQVSNPFEAIQINQEAWDEFADTLAYPLYFFDFETVVYGVPVFDYSRPYQQIPFQYSLHIKTAANSESHHKAFLGDGWSDPRLALVEKLLQDAGDKGSILVWNAVFERSRIHELMRDFPDHEVGLSLLLERMIDLANPFKRNGAIGTAPFGGSWSLKAVLPVLAPHLSYAELNISNGGDASFIYSELAGMNEASYQQTRQDLLDYCYLDTWGMVVILEKIEKIK